MKESDEQRETTQSSTADIAAERTATETQPDAEERAELLESGESERFRARWTDIQATFVDEPRRAVESADTLVADLMKRLAQGFAEERSGLEDQWAQGGDVSTEELRVALQRYRSFFNRLLTT
ncbi:hypothetical protein BH24ACT26_BH24ACT26_07400 [soil metagenome]